MERVHPDVEAARVRSAVKLQRNVLPGLSDDRLRVIRARLLADGDDAVTRARIEVVTEELARRAKS